MKGREQMATLLTETNVTSSSTMDKQTADTLFEKAFHEHWSWVCQTLYKLVEDWDEAEDLAVQVFTKLRNNPPRERDKIGSWLHRVAMNTGFNALRARQRRRHYETNAGILRLQQAASGDPAFEVEQREMHRIVRQVLIGMPSRAAHLLFYRMLGLSYAEIAAALNVAPGSVGTLLSRAERMFARRFHKMEGL